MRAITECSDDLSGTPACYRFGTRRPFPRRRRVAGVRRASMPKPSRRIVVSDSPVTRATARSRSVWVIQHVLRGSNRIKKRNAPDTGRFQLSETCHEWLLATAMVEDGAFRIHRDASCVVAVSEAKRAPSESVADIAFKDTRPGPQAMRYLPVVSTVRFEPNREQLSQPVHCDCGTGKHCASVRRHPSRSCVAVLDDRWYGASASSRSEVDGRRDDPS